jgi:hypothetical protein
LELLIFVGAALVALVFWFYLGISAFVVLPIMVGVAFVGWLIGGSAGALVGAVICRHHRIDGHSQDQVI